MKKKILLSLLIISLVSFTSGQSYDSWGDVVIDTSETEGINNIFHMISAATENEYGEEGEITADEINDIYQIIDCGSNGIATVGECQENENSELNIERFNSNEIDVNEMQEIETPSEVRGAPGSDWEQRDSNFCDDKATGFHHDGQSTWFYCNADVSSDVDDWARECDTGSVDTEVEGGCQGSADVTNYLSLNEQGTQIQTQGNIGKGNRVSIDLNISTNDPVGYDVSPTVNLLEVGLEGDNTIASRNVNVNTNSLETISFSWEDINGANRDYPEDVKFGVEMEGNEEGDAWWSRDTISSIGSATITRCGPGYIYNSFHDGNDNTQFDGCINENVGELENTDWQIFADPSSKHTLNSISTSVEDGRRELNLDSGDTGICGEMYFRNKYTAKGGGVPRVDVKVSNDNGHPVFLRVDGEEVINETSSISPGVTESFRPNLAEGEFLDIGIKGSESLGCNQYYRRNDITITVPEGDFE